MPISTRTPEGEPLQCPICGTVAALEIADPTGDALCPACGHLLWMFRDSVSRVCGVPLEEIALSASLRDDLDMDSLAVVELVMELEDRGGMIVPDGDYEKLRTVRDVLDYLRRRPSDENAS